jgi:hypothetical protein
MTIRWRPACSARPRPRATKSGMQITQPETDLLDELLAPARASTAAQEWDAWVAGGRTLSQPEALALLRSLNPP